MFMKPHQVIEALGALAHDHRLAIFRLLVERGPEGLPAGKIAERVGLVPSSLTFHVQALQRSITVCDNAAGEVCPVWPGKPMSAHWGIADPAAVEGTDAQKGLAFRKAFKELETRIKLFTALPIKSLDGMKLQETLRAIGKAPSAEA
jgi:DNA-binding transcriptional ArsR family regulator